MQEFTVTTRQHTQFVNIDAEVRHAIEAEGLQEGAAVIFVPHTTAAVTINENADPDVVADMHQALETAVPWKAGYAHIEGNAAAHVKASMMGASETVIVREGRPVLGTWQSIFFCEFDGPRARKVYVTGLSR